MGTELGPPPVTGLWLRPREYLLLRYALSGAGLVVVFLLALLAGLGPLLSIAAGFLFFSILLFAVGRAPRALAARSVAHQEAELPIALRALAVELAINTPLETALERLAGSPGRLAGLFGRVSNEIARGESVQGALRGLAAGSNSLLLKRAAGQLIHAYEHGGDGGLKKLADEAIDLERASAREHAARAAFLGLFFTAGSCVVPSLFAAYLAVGSAFFSVPLSPAGVWLAYLVAFPALAGVLLLFVAISTPPSLLTRKATAPLSAEEWGQLDTIASSLHLPKLQIFFASLAVAAVVLAIAFGAAFLILRSPLAGVLAIGALAIPLGGYLFLRLKLESRQTALENFLPDALFQAATLGRGVKPERAIEAIAGAGYGELSAEFRAAANEIAAGSSVPRSLRAIGARNSGSLLLGRAVGLIATAYSTGAEMETAIRETAEDIFELFGLVRERASMLAMQRYTLLIGGSVLVPVILGAITGVVSSLDLSAIGAAAGVVSSPGLASAAAGSAPFYALILSLLTCLFAGQQEGSALRGVAYFAFFGPLAFTLFGLAAGGALG